MLGLGLAVVEVAMMAIKGGNVDNGADRRGKKHMVLIASGGDAQELVVV